MKPTDPDSKPSPPRRKRSRLTEAQKARNLCRHLTGGTFPSAMALLYQFGRSYEKQQEIIPQMGVLLDSIEERARQVNAGDLSGPETMLLGQAIALENIFSCLMKESTGWKIGHEPHERVLKLAFRAQAQSARTLEILAGMKLGPRVVLTKQLNAATNQIVNNAPETGEPEPERIVRLAQKTEIPPASPAEPLTIENHAPLDPGIPTTPTQSHSNLAPVEKIHRPANRRRKEKEQP